VSLSMFASTLMLLGMGVAICIVPLRGYGLRRESRLKRPDAAQAGT
jgi:hypothetical protein